MDIGFIGLGHMGEAMARNLLKAGHRVTVYNRTRDKAEKLAAEGAAIADSPAGASHGEAVITMLANDEAVEAVVFGEEGVLAGLRRDAVHISMSTISVALSDRLDAAHAAAGQRYVAAPVLGRPEVAAAAKLFVLAAGPEAAIGRCQVLFDAMGQKTFVIGDKPSRANLVKLACNFLLASMLESLGEAFALVRKGGIEPQRFLEVVTGSMFSAPAYKTYGPIIAEERYEPAGFKMTLALKDIRLALAAADAEAVPMPAASLVRDHMLQGIAQGEGNSDWAGIARIVARNAGL
ncbi:MAG: NAD(P)-dependent oxidoreductase [Rhodospirillales bacterium]|nr:NAD(P)-dependent oxidoreductase [Rhodospirillales bacterium]